MTTRRSHSILVPLLIALLCSFVLAASTVATGTAVSLRDWYEKIRFAPNSGKSHTRSRQLSVPTSTKPILTPAPESTPMPQQTTEPVSSQSQVTPQATPVVAQQPTASTPATVPDTSAAVAATVSKQAVRAYIPAQYTSTKISSEYRDAYYKLAIIAALLGILIYGLSYEYIRSLMYDRPRGLVMSSTN